MFAEETPMGNAHSMWPDQLNLWNSQTTTSCNEIPSLAPAGNAAGNANGLVSALNSLNSPYTSGAGAAQSTKSLTEAMYSPLQFQQSFTGTKDIFGEGLYATVGLTGLDADLFGFASANSFFGGQPAGQQPPGPSATSSMMSSSLSSHHRRMPCQPAAPAIATALPADGIAAPTLSSLLADAADHEELEASTEKPTSVRSRGTSKVSKSGNSKKGKSAAAAAAAVPKKLVVSTKKLGHTPSAKQRGVGNPSDFGGLTDDEICDLDYKVLLARIAKMKGPLKNKVKERRKQLKNRIHAKRAAAKREKRNNKKEEENGGLQMKADRLLRENAQLVAETSELQQKRTSLDSDLLKHRQEMRTLQAKLAEMSATLQRVQQANADITSITGVGVSGGGLCAAQATSANSSHHARSTHRSILVPSDGNEVAHRRAPRTSRGGSAATSILDMSVGTGSNTGDSDVWVASVPDASDVWVMPSPDVEVSLNQLALGYTDSRKHTIDEPTDPATTKSGKRMRLLHPA